jgi:uncharacterized protein YbaR (Trm112 family)
LNHRDTENTEKRRQRKNRVRRQPVAEMNARTRKGRYSIVCLLGLFVSVFSVPLWFKKLNDFSLAEDVMISQEFLDLLRCPMDPGNTRLEQADNALVCQRCRLKFAIKEGIPSLLVEEAELPPGCQSLQDLPCQEAARTVGTTS